MDNEIILLNPERQEELVDLLLGGNKTLQTEIIEMYETAVSNNDDVRSLLHRTAKLFFPNSDTFFQHTKDGNASENKSFEIHDSTPMLAGTAFVNFLKNTMTQAGTTFFELEAESKSQQYIADKWTQTCHKHIQTSNFDRIIHKFYENLALGTGGLKVAGRNSGRGSALIFKSFNLDKLYVDVDVDEFPNIVFYKHISMSKNDLVRGWGINRFDKDREKKGRKRDVIEFSIYLYSVLNGNGDWVDKHLYGVADTDFKHIYLADMLDYSPIFVTRFDTRAGTVPYGYSPAVNMISTAEELNKMKAMFKEGTEFSYKPPIIVQSPEGEVEIEKLELKAGRALPVEYGTTVTPVQITFDPSGLLGEIADARGTIRTGLMTEAINSVEQARYVTAEAVSLIQRQFMNVFSGTWGSIQNEFIMPLAKTIVFLLDKMNMLEYPDGEEMSAYKVIARNPIARNNDWAEIDRIVSDFQTTAGIVGAELALEKFDIPELVMRISEIIGTDKDLLKSEKTLKTSIAETRQALLQMGGSNVNGEEKVTA